jgi:hypothetical protein
MINQSQRPFPVATVILVGLTCLVYELLQVRMLAFFLGNSMDFLAIPIALLGLGIGSMYGQFLFKGPPAVLVARLRLAVLPLLVATFLLFFFVADTWFDRIHVGLADPAVDSVRLLVYSAIFLPPYLALGAILSCLFGIHASRIGRLYFFDLAGAALGCVLAPLLLTFVDLWAAIVGVLAGGLGLWIVQTRHRPVLLGTGVVGFLVVSVLAARGVLVREHPDPQALARYVLSGAPGATAKEVTAKWNEIARTSLIRIERPDESKEQARYGIVQDNGLSNVSLYPWRPDADREKLLSDALFHGLPWVLGHEPRRILVMFAGAGRDMILFDHLARGQADITGVELNPLVVDTSHLPVVRHLHLREFHRLPRIHLVVEEGRNFLNHDEKVYDHIHVANNGAVFANRTGHSRKFLDTYEAMAAYLDHLSPDGMIVFQSQTISEKITSFIRLFEERGLGDPKRALFAFGPPGLPEIDNLLVKPSGFSAEEISTLIRHVAEVGKVHVVLYAPGVTPNTRRIADLVDNPANVRFVTDDRPFIQGLALSRLEWVPSTVDLKDQRYVSSWVKVFSIALFSLATGVVALTARLAGGREMRVPARWVLYLLASGIGFMGVEIGLIAKSELFVGNPLYAVALNLAVFLVATSIGALLQDRVLLLKNPLRLAAGSTLSILWAVLAVEACDRSLLSFALPIKAMALIVATFPVGLALGAFYPYCVQRVVHSGKERCVPMTYTLATLSSVLGSVIAMTAIIDVGFTAVIAVGAGLYVVASSVAWAGRT